MDLPKEYENLFKSMNHSSDNVKDIEWIKSKESDLGTKIPLCLKSFLLSFSPENLNSEFEFDLDEIDGFDNYYEIANFYTCDFEGSIVLEKTDQEIIDCSVYFINEDDEAEKLFDSIYDWFMASVGKSKDLDEINLTDKYKEYLTDLGSKGFNVKSKYWIENTEKKLGAKLPAFLKAILLKYDTVYFQAPGTHIFCGEVIREYLEEYQDYFAITKDEMGDTFVIEKSKDEVLDSPVDFVHSDQLGGMFNSIYDMMETMYHCNY